MMNLDFATLHPDYLLDAVNDAYFDAVKIAVKETGISKANLPPENPYTMEQLLDEEFYPEANFPQQVLCS